MTSKTTLQRILEKIFRSKQKVKHQARHKKYQNS